MSFAEDYKSYCQANGVPDRLELLLCDINAILRGKWLPGDAAQKLAQGGVRLPLSTYAPAIMGNEVEGTGLGLEIGDPDGIVQPVAGTLSRVPWASGHVAQVLVEMTDEAGQISPTAPRAVLAAISARFEALGLRPVVATELEFYILRARDKREEAPTPPGFTPDVQNYDMELAERRADILNDILSASAAQGLPTDTLIAEYGPGQFEINFQHTDDVMAAAETALLFRRLVRGVVASHGFEATFMAKPYADQPGNGLHVHASVLDEAGGNIFAATGDQPLPAPLGHAVAGVLATMVDLQAIFAPHGNSYRRFRVGSFAPSIPNWGIDNRAAAIRVPEVSGPAARLEHRISGADANPFLALAAILGGVLFGLETKPDLPPALDDPASVAPPPLTHDWVDAVERFATSPIAGGMFGAYRDLYAAVKRAEIAVIQDPIPPAEYTYYLSRF